MSETPAQPTKTFAELSLAEKADHLHWLWQQSQRQQQEITNLLNRLANHKHLPDGTLAVTLADSLVGVDGFRANR